jgi:Glycosyl transferases, related to UDP-glucuronosyltransferase
MACAAGLRIVVAWGGGEERLGRALLVSRFDPREELGRARLMIHHGGQNSCHDCLAEGIPQLAIPGRHFERSANAKAVVEAGAGLAWDRADGEAALDAAVERLLSEDSFAHRAKDLGDRLEAAGGWDKALEAIEGIEGS